MKICPEPYSIYLRGIRLGGIGRKFFQETMMRVVGRTHLEGCISRMYSEEVI